MHTKTPTTVGVLFPWIKNYTQPTFLSFFLLPFPICLRLPICRSSSAFPSVFRRSPCLSYLSVGLVFVGVYLRVCPSSCLDLTRCRTTHTCATVDTWCSIKKRTPILPVKKRETALCTFLRTAGSTSLSTPRREPQPPRPPSSTGRRLWKSWRPIDSALGDDETRDRASESEHTKMRTAFWQINIAK